MPRTQSSSVTRSNRSASIVSETSETSYFVAERDEPLWPKKSRESGESLESSLSPMKISKRKAASDNGGVLRPTRSESSAELVDKESKSKSLQEPSAYKSRKERAKKDIDSNQILALEPIEKRDEGIETDNKESNLKQALLLQDKKKYEDALVLFEKAIACEKSEEKSDFHAHYLVGLYYKQLPIGTLKRKQKVDNQKKAYDYFYEASQKNHWSAMKELSDCFKNGFGTQKDLDRAQYWREEALRVLEAGARGEDLF